MVTVTFEYEKLQKFFSRCTRLTHDGIHCPFKPRSHHQKGLNRRYEGDEERRYKQAKVGSQKHLSEQISNRVQTYRIESKGETSSAAATKLVQIELFAELRDNQTNGSQGNRKHAESTKECVKKAFGKGDGSIVGGIYKGEAE